MIRASTLPGSFTVPVWQRSRVGGGTPAVEAVDLGCHGNPVALTPNLDRLRGDTDFSLTGHFDRWAERVDFLFGMDAHPKLVRRAESLTRDAKSVLQRKEKYAKLSATTRERYQEHEKERIVVERKYLNLKLNSEEVVEFTYRPRKCERDYRVVVVGKNITKMRGERALFDEIRYFCCRPT